LRPGLADPPYKLGPEFKRALSLWNPLDYLRLLYWVFFHPQWIREYVKWRAPEYPQNPLPSETWALLKGNKHIRSLTAQAFLLIPLLAAAMLMILSAVGVPTDIIKGVAFGVAFGVAGGVAFGLLFLLSFGLAQLRIPLYLFYYPPPLAAKFDGLIWLPLPGLQRSLVKALDENKPAGIALCKEYLDFTMQFIPVEGAVNRVMKEDAAGAHSWCRLLLQYDLDGLIHSGTVSLRNRLWDQFYYGLLVIPNGKRRKWFPLTPRTDTPDRTVCAGFNVLRSTGRLGFKLGRDDVPEALDSALNYFRQASQVNHAYETINAYALLRDSLVCKTALNIAALFSRSALPL